MVSSKKKMKKIIVGVLMGILALSASVTSGIRDPVSVEAAVKLPSPLFKLNKSYVTVGKESGLSIETLINMKSIKGGYKSIKEGYLTTPKNVYNTNDLVDTQGTYWAYRAAVFPKKGTYKIGVTLVNNKGKKLTKYVTVKVADYSKYMKIRPIKVKKGSCKGKIDLSKYISYNKKYIKGYNFLGTNRFFSTNRKKGTYYEHVEFKGVSGESYTVSMGTIVIQII